MSSCAPHPDPRAVLFGLDRSWCERGDNLVHFGYGPIPQWLYDGDLTATFGNLLTMHAIETASRSLSAVFGLSPRTYGRNGYALISVDRHPYDQALAKRLITRDLAVPWAPPPSPDPASWRYVALDWLAERLDALPADTRKLLVFVPRHHLYPAPGSVGAAMMDECKRRVVRLARERPNAMVLDFSIPSPITMEEDRWWDAVHLRPENDGGGVQAARRRDRRAGEPERPPADAAGRCGERGAMNVAERIADADWGGIGRELDANGCAVTGALLDAADCAALASGYDDDSRYRARIVMARHGFGQGEYKYFAHPPPPIVQTLRTALYSRLAEIANRWQAALGRGQRFPPDHAAFLAQCRDAGQTRPTPLLPATAQATTTASTRTSTASCTFRSRSPCS